MNTECSAERINFHGLGGRGVVGRFDGGRISSDEGCVLLREVDGVKTEIHYPVSRVVQLTQRGYRYLVVSRGGVHQFDAQKAVEITSVTGEAIRIQRTLSEDGKEALLYFSREVSSGLR